MSRLPAEYGPPTITINGADGVTQMYDLQRQIGPRDRSNEIFEFKDTVSWQASKHYLKFGAEISRRHVTFEQARAPRGPLASTAPTPARPSQTSCWDM